MKRFLAILICAAALSGTTASTAAAAPTGPDDDFVTIDLVHCPLPWLLTAYGPLSYCTRASLGGPPVAQGGYYSPVTDGFSESTGWIDRVGEISTIEFGDLEATDGIVGLFRGYAIMDTGGYGHVTYGNQYRLDGTTSVGRWGFFSWGTGTFHPTGGWHETDRPF